VSPYFEPPRPTPPGPACPAKPIRARYRLVRIQASLQVRPRLGVRATMTRPRKPRPWVIHAACDRSASHGIGSRWARAVPAAMGLILGRWTRGCRHTGGCETLPPRSLQPLAAGHARGALLRNMMAALRRDEGRPRLKSPAAAPRRSRRCRRCAEQIANGRRRSWNVRPRRPAKAGHPWRVAQAVSLLMDASQRTTHACIARPAGISRSLFLRRVHDDTPFEPARQLNQDAALSPLPMFSP